MSEITPPSNLTEKEAEEWWRKKLKEAGLSGRIPTTNEKVRVCPNCGAANVCTGLRVCAACQHPLNRAKRNKNDERHSPEYY